MELEGPKISSRSEIKHRSRIQILAEILMISAGDGVSQSEIIIGAKLSYRQIKSYLDWLVATNLLETTVRQNNKIGFKITAKGYRLLSILDNVQQLLHNPEYLNIVPVQLR